MSAPPDPWDDPWLVARRTEFMGGLYLETYEQAMETPWCTCPKSCYQHGASLKSIDEVLAGRYSQEAFDLLLAVAKASQEFFCDDAPHCESPLCVATRALDAAAPGWREWA